MGTPLGVDCSVNLHPVTSRSLGNPSATLFPGNSLATPDARGCEHMSQRRSVNLTPIAFPARSDKGGTRDSQISAIADWAEAYATSAIDWYLHQKQSKARWSRFLRLSAIILATIGGVWPLALSNLSLPVWINNGGYVSLALAAGTIGLDKFFGFSSAWIRYMKTQLQLQGLLQEFQLERHSLKDPEHATQISSTKIFLENVNGEILNETQLWSDEFQGVLTELRSTSR